MVHATLQKSAALREVSQIYDQTAVIGDEEGVSNACELFVAINAAVS
jgi:hypothetical protein